MSFEKDYIEAVDCAIKAKKQYLKDALEREALSRWKSIGLDGWSEMERREQYEQEVVPYWKRFGFVPKQFWFELSGSRDHRMDPRFIPDDLYYTEIIPYLNNGQQFYGLSNKGYYDFFFSDVKQAKTVALKIEGLYCDEERNIITVEDVIDRCREHKGTLFIKPSTNTHSGEGIIVVEPAECSDDDIRKLLEGSGSSFIIQERIRQHPLLNRLNPLSVCTIRVISLIFDNKVSIENAAIRIGGPEQLFVTVNDGCKHSEILEDHRLHSKILLNSDSWVENGGGLFDDRFVVPSMEKVYEEILRIHPRLGHFKCIGWDFSIDEDGDAVLIELNPAPAAGDGSQLVCCRPMFNEKTDWILEDYFERRTWETNHFQNILIQ